MSKAVALIIGGGSGIGADAAKNLSAKGYDVAVVNLHPNGATDWRVNGATHFGFKSVLNGKHY